MALDPLATVADLTALGVTVDPSETAVVNQWLAIASALVRDAAGSPISQTTSTITIEGEADRRLHLPGLPIQSVSAVAINGEPLTEWRLRSNALWRSCGWRYPHCAPSEVTVTYVHGLPTVPPDIVALVCRLVALSLVEYRRAGNDGAETAAARTVASERIGDYSVSYAGVSGSAADSGEGVMSLTGYQRNKLAARFGGGVANARAR